VVDFEMLKIMSELNAPPPRKPRPAAPSPQYSNNEPIVEEVPANLVVAQPESVRKAKDVVK
jgi:hypothetical protein